MSTFTALRDQLLRLPNDEISAEDAERNLRRIGEQATRFYHHHAQAGVRGFDLELTKRLRLSGRVGDPTDDQCWWGRWIAITLALVIRYPHRVSSDT